MKYSYYYLIIVLMAYCIPLSAQKFKIVNQPEKRNDKKIEIRDATISLDTKHSVTFYDSPIYLINKEMAAVIAFQRLDNKMLVTLGDSTLYNGRGYYYVGRIKSKRDKSLKKKRFLIIEIGNNTNDFIYAELPERFQANPKKMLEQYGYELVFYSVSNSNSSFIPTTLKLTTVEYYDALRINDNPELKPLSRRFGTKAYRLLSRIDGTWHSTDGYKFHFLDNPARFWHPKMKKDYYGIDINPYNHLIYRAPNIVYNGEDCFKLISNSSEYSFPTYIFCQGGLFYDDIDGLKVLKGINSETNDPVYFISDGDYKSRYNFVNAMRKPLSIYIDQLFNNDDPDIDVTMETYRPILVEIMGEEEYLLLYTFLKSTLQD